MIVIGTAGHIDHGKSSIVKRLTGTDPDRLPEEKKRGMTIDLGFAFYQTPEKDSIAFVDVPGHERFVKNMIAGAGGIDVVMLVIAADDGWMPQTEEHFQIVRMLGVKHGMIVINKCDLVQSEQIKLFKSDIENRISESFLFNVPIFSVSSTTGIGFDELKAHLDSLTKAVATAEDIGKGRLYIDRAFIRQGIGTVVTGTLKNGTLSAGQTVSLWPSLGHSKIKSLQTNNRSVSSVRPGQRTAVSLSRIGKEEIQRGDVVTTISELRELSAKTVLALSAELLKNSPVVLSNRRIVTLMIGTSETEAEIRLLDDTKILPGQSGIVLLKPADKVFSMIGDHVILRLPTPMITIGGGIILDHLSRVPRKKELKQLEYLRTRNVFEPSQLLLNELKKKVVSKPEELLRFSNFKDKNISDSLEKLIESGQCGSVGEFVIESKMFEEIINQILTNMSKDSALKKRSEGWTLPQIMKLGRIDLDVATALLNFLIREKKLESKDEKYFLWGELQKVSPEIEIASNAILAKLKTDYFAPPSIDSLVTNGKSSKQAIRLLIESNKVHKCGSEFLFTVNAWNDILDFIRKTLTKQKELKVGELRDKFKITRKHAIPILEETDRLKITSRKGDVRVKGSNFES